MCGAIPPLPNTPSWRGSPLKAQGQLMFYETVSMSSYTENFLSHTDESEIRLLTLT